MRDSKKYGCYICSEAALQRDGSKKCEISGAIVMRKGEITPEGWECEVNSLNKI